MSTVKKVIKIILFLLCFVCLFHCLFVFFVFCRGVYFTMVMELDLNVTDPAVNRRDVEQMIPHYCSTYLRHHSFQLNSTVFVNSTTFGIKVCSGCRELKQPRRLRQIKRH